MLVPESCVCGNAAHIAVPQAPPETILVDLEEDDPEAPFLPASAPVRKRPDMAAVNKIVGPVAPPPPPPVAKSDATCA